MPEQTVNPDVVMQQYLQAKMEEYKALEHYQAVRKVCGDAGEALLHVNRMMKARIIELEEEIKKKKEDKGKS